MSLEIALRRCRTIASNPAPTLVVILAVVAIAGTGCQSQHEAVRTPRPKSPPRPNTWHYTGWRLVGGKKVPWEIWGQRKPSFYREQLGDYTMVTENSYEMRLIPPMAPAKPHLILIRSTSNMPVMMGDPNTNIKNSRLLGVSIDNDLTGMDRPDTKRFQAIQNPQDDKDTTTLEAPFTRVFQWDSLEEKVTLQVDKQSKLPVHYRSEWKGWRNDWTQPVNPPNNNPIEKAELTLRYGEPISDSLHDIAPPPDTAIVDTRLPGKVVTSQKEAAGATVSLLPRITARDAAGNILVRLDAWAGGKDLRDLPASSYLNSDTNYSPYGAQRVEAPVKDDKGNSYIPINDGSMSFQEPDCLFIPLEPLQGTKQAPHSLSIAYNVMTSWFDMVKGEPGQPSVGLTSTPLGATLPLPTAGTIPGKFQTAIVNPSSKQVPLALASEMVRARYYLSILDRNPAFASAGNGVTVPDSVKQAKVRCAYWVNAALHDLSRSGVPAQDAGYLRQVCVAMQKRLNPSSQNVALVSHSFRN